MRLAFERLEDRRLLTTVHGGDTFRFLDANGKIEQVSLVGNITAELIGASVAGNTATLLNLPGSLNGTAVNGGIPAMVTTSTDTLFAVYVSNSDATGGISIAELNAATGTTMTTGTVTTAPFTGSIGSLRVLNPVTGDSALITAPANSGGALLGARTLLPMGAMTMTDNIPILTAPVSQTFGVLNPSITTLHSGLIVAPGQNIGKFLVGGTVLGQVQIHGSIDQFYAGWLLTGNAAGESLNSVTSPQNFLVDGDLRNLLVRTDIGSDADTGLATTPDFLSGFDLRVNGTLGTVQAGGAIVGSVNAAHSTNNDVSDQSEIELRGPATFDPFASVELGAQAGDTYFNNDTFATAQYISASGDAALQAGGSVVVNGTLQGDHADNVDYYAVPLLAGQTITVQATGSTLIDVGVFDPSGREIATDYNAVDMSQTQNQQFQLKVTQPGVYRFAVGTISNGTFGAGGGSTIYLFGIGYKLTIGGVGDLGIGNIVGAGNVADNSASGSAGFGTTAGDLGAIVSGGTLFSFQNSGSNTSIVIPNGNLRALMGATVGLTGFSTNEPQLSVPNGEVGLVQSTGALDINNLGPNVDTPAIGGNYQDIIAGGNISGQYITNDSIGTIQAASSTSRGTKFRVNDGNSATPGVIDLIDVTGDLGSIAYGGPAISTGVSGNVRYLHVGGSIYQDPFFGGISPVAAINYAPGLSTTITDDSGGRVTMTPIDTVATVTTTATTGTTTVPGTTVTRVTNANGGVTTTTTTITVSGTTATTTVTTDTTTALSVTTYGIEGSGGSAIVNVTSGGGLTLSGSGGTAEIGTLTSNQIAGTPIDPGIRSSTINVGNGTTIPLPSLPTASTTNGSALDVTLSGGVRLDVFDIEGGEFSSIADNTSGEIVNIHATSVGALSASNSLGIPKSDTGAAIVPAATASNTYPYVDQHTGIDITGDVISVSAPHVGNLMIGGDVGSVSGSIDAPVVSGGSIHSINIGTGVAPSGSGAVGFSGIYAAGEIGPITGGNGANIRGNVISNTGITSISLGNGSIIDTTVGSSTSFAGAEVFRSTFNIPRQTTVVTRPTLDIGSITTDGVGGIIGTRFFGEQTGSITVGGGGFGIFNSAFFGLGDSTIGSISASGYGIRGVTAESGASIGSINATGNGSLSSIINYTGQVRYSESFAVDPFTGFAPNRTTDIDVYLGTTPTTPVIPNVTDTGVIEDDSFAGQRDLGSIRAYQIRSTDPGVAPTTINFANSIGSIVTTSLIDGMSVTTGKLGTFSPGGDVMHGTLQIAGIIKSLILHGNFRDSSTIRATGRNGNIKSIRVMGNLDGTIEADGGKITKAVIDGSLDGSIISKTLAALVLNGSLGNGALKIAGNVNSITTAGNLGTTGDTLTINGKLGTLKVGGSLYANVTVGTTLGKAIIADSIISGSTITVPGVFSTLQVGGDFQAGATVRTHRLKSKKVRGSDAGAVVLT